MSEQELDRLLDAALPGYLAKPPVGIERRIVARVQACQPRLWPWAAGMAAAAALFVAVLLPRPAANGIAPPPLLAQAPSAPSVHIAPSVRVTHKPARHRLPSRRNLPLTRRENALIQFAEINPELARQVLVEGPEKMAAPLDLQPLAFEPITIEPLASASGGE